MNRVEDQELKRNGEGYLDLTAYHAIKKADADMEGKKKEKTKKRVYSDAYDRNRSMTLKQYIKWKLKVLDELGIELNEEEEAYLRSIKTEYEIDAYAHRLIMNKE